MDIWISVAQFLNPKDTSALAIAIASSIPFAHLCICESGVTIRPEWILSLTLQDWTMASIILSKVLCT